MTPATGRPATEVTGGAELTELTGGAEVSEDREDRKARKARDVTGHHEAAEDLTTPNNLDGPSTRDALASPATLEIVEYTDPLCPWAWGSEPVFRRLRAALAGDDRIRWRRVYCILFDHDDDPAPDPAAETAWYARYVEDISAHTHAPRALRLSRVAASSWPASLVAKAAEAQGTEVADRVLRRLRESVFVLGEPADTPESALAAVSGVPGLDADRLAIDAASPEVLAQVCADHAEARRPVAEVLSVHGGDSPHPGAAKETPDGQHRYALPTLLVRTAAGHCVVPGWRPYEEYVAAVTELSRGLLPAPTTPHPESPAQPALAPTPLPPATALSHYRTLTDPERTHLTDATPWPPPGAVRMDTANGPLWLHPDEAAVHPATALSPPAAPR
ncbi:DsbA family protein [Streptomyces sp. NBC_01239]|uniref:DsbA family oxidoreductase n=1 Tax=Streptomyces sp. NBC_01239 TaxID=2903792 RepID=UPI002256A898|nr:DsbA family protein [Streptomyces sp. NBC_01239]MCX4816261.1 DsbA family protein [Streptomyces sp. NBC_01239]